MIKITVKTSDKREIVDITDRINGELGKQNISNFTGRKWPTGFGHLAESGISRT